MKTLLASFLCLASLVLVAAPANDNFADRIPIIASGSVSVTGSNVGATFQSGDPYYVGPVHSVWWTWTAPFSGPTTISTYGSSFDTLLAVCTGDTLGSLPIVATNDDYGNYTSQVTFNAVAGVPYAIFVNGYNGASGLINLAITVSGGGCTFALSPSSKAVSYPATNGTVTVTATTGCAWSAVSNDSFLTVTSGNSGTGNGSVAYNVAANTLLTTRTGTMTIAGSTFTVTQGAAPGCTYGLSPPTAHYDSNPITNTVAMTAGTGCAWTATPNASWLTISGLANGTGNGTITYIVATNSLSNQRIGTITAAGQTHTVTQDGAVPCTFAISPSSAPFLAAGGTSNIVVSTLTACTWTASSSASWVTFSSTNGSGNGTVTYTVAANTVTVPRSTILTVAGNSFTVTQAAAACSYALTSSSLSAAATASSSTVGVTTTTGCAWTAVANVSWLTITAGSSGSGSGTVSFAVAANLNTTTRAGTLTIAGQTFTVNQAAAPCIYSMAPTSAHFSEASQGGSVAVTAGTGCAWTAVSNTGFIVVNSGTPGSGNGTVAYSVSANATSTSRTGTMTIAGQTFTVTQDGTAPCTYSISPTSCACASTAGTASIAVTANATCAWSVTSSDPSWLTFSPASGTGNGTVVYTITANPSSIQRTATLTIAGQIFTVQQAGIGCTFTVVPTSASFTFVGGSGTATVTTSAGCSWASTSDSSWLTITSGSSGVGNGSVGYSVTAQTVSTSRIGRLTIAGRVLNVTQTGAPCTTSISPASALISDFGGGGTINITESDPACAWTATSNASWLTVVPLTGTGNGTATFTATPTSLTTSRIAVITISGQTFTVTQSGDTTLPIVTLTAPTAGSTVSNVIAISATATDDVSMSRVDFFYDAATLIGSDTTSPYSLAFNTTNLSNAAHTFYARGFDSANNQGTSATNSVTISNTAAAITNVWAQRFGSTLNDGGTGVVIDNASNIVMTGYFKGTINLGGSPISTAGAGDVFIAKYDSNGTHQWSFGYGSTGDESPSAIARDSTGNIYVVGSYTGSANFGGSTLTNAGQKDSFIAKYNSSGAHQWSKRFGSTGIDLFNSVAVDSNDDVLVTGTFVGTVNFGGTNLVSSSNAQGESIVLAKFSSAGAHIWSETFVGGSSNWAYGVAVDGANNVFITGAFYFTINFGGGVLTAVTAQFLDMYVAKFASTGAYTWAKQYGGTSGDRSVAITIDGNNDAVVCGNFSKRTDLGGGLITGSAVDVDGFVAKYSGVNGAYIWAKGIVGNNGCYAIAVRCDSSNNPIVVGYFYGTFNFGGQSLTSVLNSYDGWMAKYSSAGVLQRASSYGGSTSDFGSALAISSDNYASVTGSFSGTGTFNGTVLTSTGGTDVFLMRLLP